MSDTTRLPRYLIITELAGGILVLLSIVLINCTGRLPGGRQPETGKNHPDSRHPAYPAGRDNSGVPDAQGYIDRFTGKEIT